MKQTSHIGKVLLYDEPTFSLFKNELNELIQPVNALLNFYQELNIGKADLDVLQELISGSAQKIKDRYKAAVQETIKNLNIKAKAVVDNFYLNIDNDMKEFDKLHSAFRSQLKLIPDNLRFLINSVLKEFTVIDGEAVIDKNSIEEYKKKFQVIIQTEEQSNVYQLYLKAKDALDVFKKASWEKHSLQRTPFVSPIPATALLHIDGDGEMTLNPGIMNVIK